MGNIEKEPQVEPQEEEISRREFLIRGFRYIAAAAVFFLASCSKNERDETYSDLEEDYDLAQKLNTPEKLLEHIEQESQHIEFGANLSWEHLNWLCQEEYNVETPSVKTVFGYIKELGIEHVRVPFYIDQCWDHESDSVSLRDEYIEILEEARAMGIQLTISYGLKTPRWPEEHITEAQLVQIYGSKENIPPSKSEILLDTPLGLFLQDYTRRILEILKEYSEVIEAIQPENEPFNHFGQHEWIISPELLVKEIEIAREVFPKKYIYLNSPMSQGHPAKLRDKVIHKIEDINLLQLFWNNYVMFPWGDFFQKDDENFGDDYAAAEMTIHRGEMEQINEYFSSIGVKTGISELQMEPWGNFDPLKTFSRFSYNILRQIRALQLKKNPRDVRLDIWGLERLLLEGSQEQGLRDSERGALKVISMLNNQKK